MILTYPLLYVCIITPSTHSKMFYSDTDTVFSHESYPIKKQNTSTRLLRCQIQLISGCSIFHSLNLPDDTFKGGTFVDTGVMLLTSTPNELLLFICVVYLGPVGESCNYCKNLIALASSLPVLNVISSVGGNSLDTDSWVSLPHMRLDTLTNCLLHCK